LLSLAFGLQEENQQFPDTAIFDTNTRCNTNFGAIIF